MTPTYKTIERLTPHLALGALMAAAPISIFAAVSGCVGGSMLLSRVQRYMEREQ